MKIQDASGRHIEFQKNVKISGRIRAITARLLSACMYSNALATYTTSSCVYSHVLPFMFYCFTNCLHVLWASIHAGFPALMFSLTHIMYTNKLINWLTYWFIDWLPPPTRRLCDQVGLSVTWSVCSLTQIVVHRFTLFFMKGRS